MCIIDMSRNIYIADAEGARDFLRANGLDAYQIDEFSTILHSENFLDLEYENECLRAEFKSYEASLDAAQGVLNELLCICGDKMQTERTKAARGAYSTIYNLILHSEAV